MADLTKRIAVPRVTTLAGGTDADLEQAAKSNPGVIVLQAQLEDDGMTVNALKFAVLVGPNLYGPREITLV